MWTPSNGRKMDFEDVKKIYKKYHFKKMGTEGERKCLKNCFT